MRSVLLSAVLFAGAVASAAPLRILYWNIQNGMWAGQDDNYEQFVAWVKACDPDICVWCEAETLYRTGTAEVILDMDSRYLPAHWPDLAARYGHGYTARAAHCGGYPQVITSKYPIETKCKIVGKYPTRALTHGAGWFRVTKAGRDINVVTLHGSPVAYDPNVSVAERKESAARGYGDCCRKVEMEEILAATVGGTRASVGDWVMLGDFNSFSRKDAVFYSFPSDSTKYLVHDFIASATDYVDILAKMRPNVEDRATIRARRRIDFVYVSPSLAAETRDASVVRDAYTDQVQDKGASIFPRPSDHLPILVDFDLKPAKAAEMTPVDIDCGRQLFVDDFLVDSVSNVVRHWNHPVKEENPVVWPGDGAGRGVKDGGGDANLTCASDGGLWWDPTRGKYRLWYQADWLGDVCYAESADGRRWTYPDLGIVKGTNRLFKDRPLDSWDVTPDYFASNPYGAWKMHISELDGPSRDQLYASDDGIHFTHIGCAGWSNDRSVAYCDPFRGVWVFSLRDGWPIRKRSYFASRTFGGPGCRWQWRATAKDPHPDATLPKPEPWLVAANKPNWQLYNFNAVAYESLMLGVMEVLYNTPHDNADCEKVGLPKQTGLHFCFSRDGKTYVPRDEADIAPSGWGCGKWDTGYLSAISGICAVDDERLTFYYSGLRGDGTRLKSGKKPAEWVKNGMYMNGAIGVATLRRDGFAGMVADGDGELTTRPLAFTGGHLFVNADCLFGTVRAEILGTDGRPIPGFSADECAVLARRPATKAEIVFRGGDLARLGARNVRVRFLLRNATLYSFWMSPSSRGESRGYVAAGGPAYAGLRDL